MKQVLLSVGRKHDPSLSVAIDEFTTRLNREVPTTWHLIKPSGADEATARRVESLAVLEFIKSDDFVVLCDERGLEPSSEALAEKYQSWLSSARIVFVIGGAYGVSDELMKRADFIWSLSKLVFPHQLARLVVAEQLYRSRMISKNHPYHHT